MKTYRPYSPEQSYLLSPSPREWLPAGHLAYFILGPLDELDLGGIERVVQAKGPRGERPYSPEMMTSLLLYAYATGVHSSRIADLNGRPTAAVRPTAWEQNLRGGSPRWVPRDPRRSMT